MPLFEVEQNGQVYEVDAPDIQQAAAAAQAFKPAQAAPAQQMPAPRSMDMMNAVKGAVDAGDVAAQEQLLAHDATQAPDPDWRSKMSQPSFWQQIKESGPGSTILGAPEVALNMANNAVVDIVGGLTAPFVSEDSDDAANFIRDFQGQHHRQAQGDSAKILTENLGEMFAPVETLKRGLGEGALELTGSPDVAATADMLPDFLMTLMGAPKVTKPASRIDTGRRTRFDPQAPGLAEAPAADPSPPVKFDLGADTSGARESLPTPDGPVSPMVETLREADIRMRPSDIRGMIPGKRTKIPGERRESLANAADLKKDLTLHNQDRYTNLAAEELGVKDLGVQGLDEAAFEGLKKKPGGTYDMVESVIAEKGAMSEPLTAAYREALDSVKLELPRGAKPTLLGVIGTLRRRAAKAIQSDNPEANARGYADRNMADALEEELGRELKVAGEPQLFKQYQEAREQFAKIHDVESATRAGQVDAAVLHRIHKKSGGKRLSGRLKLIADAYESAPNVSGHSLKTAARAGNEIESSREGIIKGLLKAGVRKIPGMDVGSEGFQRRLGAPNEARTANYGRRDAPEAPRSPEQPDLDLREVLELDTPGEVGARPPRRNVGEQEDFLGRAFELTPPKGRTGRELLTRAEDLGDIVIDGEPLAEPRTALRAETLADILGLSEPMVKKPKKKR